MPTTAGRPYSRQTIAACDMTPPMSVTTALTFGKIGAQAGEVIGQTRMSPSRTSAISSTSITTRAGPSTVARRGGRARQPRSALLRAAPTAWTRSVVTPQSMIDIGSVIASGVTPIAGGGVQSASRSSSSLRRATIGGQCAGPSGAPPVAHVRSSSSSAVATSWRAELEDVLARPRGSRARASSAPNSRSLFHQRVRNQ